MAGIGAVASYLRRDRTTPVETAALPAAPPPKAAPAAEPPPEPAAAQPAPAKPPAEAQAKAEDEAPPTQPEKERKPPASARNPWKAPVPRALRPLRDRVNRGVPVSQRALRPVYEFAHANPGDPRPWLLLGHAYAQHDWLTDAVDRYVRAHGVDSTCRGDPQMLADLLKAAAHPVAARAAARAVRDIYGAEAIPALDKAIERSAGDREAKARLARLRESLPR